MNRVAMVQVTFSVVNATPIYMQTGTEVNEITTVTGRKTIGTVMGIGAPISLTAVW